MHDIWNPWHGCVKCSEGCAHCYMYFLDGQRGKNGAEIYRTKTGFRYPLSRDRAGNYKEKSGEQLRVGRRGVVRHGDGHHASFERERDDAAVAQDVEAHAIWDERKDFFWIYVEVLYRARGHFISPPARSVPSRRRTAARR